MNYPATVERLLTDDAFKRYAITTFGSKNALADLRGLDASKLLNASPDSKKRIKDREMAKACISGIWLLHNYLEQSHAISQDILTPAGSHWHAIMHRLEGDFHNSKYWYRRVGQWALYDDVSERSGKMFDPMQFVDRVKNEGDEATHDVAVAEWRVLFEHCLSRV